MSARPAHVPADLIPHQDGIVEWPTEKLRPHPDTKIVPRMSDDDYTQFSAEIAEHGIQTPLDVLEDGLVADGCSRLMVATERRLPTVPVRVIAPDDTLEYIFRCALERRHLTASQRATLAVELDSHRLLKAEAQTRRLANLTQNPDVAELPPRGRTREIVAKAARVSPRSVQDASVVHEHDPDLFAQVKAGELSVDRAARKVRRRLRDEALPPPPPPPEGPFDLIYADPPWQLGNPDGTNAPEAHYPCMPLNEIEQLPVPAEDNAVLLMWAVNKLLPEALQVIDAWGFMYATNLVWVKPSIGLGVWARNRHELLLIARRGKFAPPETDLRPDSVVEAPRGRHSEKPADVYDLIERAWPHASKLELFARGTPRQGWNAWGNQTATAADH